MKVLKQVEQIRVETEIEAQELIKTAKEKQNEEGFLLKKAGYEYKTKKSKGEIIGECYIVSLTKEFGGVWDEFE